jgi:hypothetical protein
MSQTVTGDITITINVADSVTTNTIAPSGDLISYQEAVTTYYGSSPLAATGLQWSSALTFTASTPQTFDITNLSGPRGSTVTFATVKAIYIVNLATTSGYTLTFGAPGTNGWYAPFDAITDTYAIPMNSRYLLENADTSTGWTVDSSHKIIKLNPGSNALTARIIILGA